MRFLHFSDSHLGLMSYGIPDRLRDMAAILDEIASIAEQHSVDLVVNAGDTFDQPKPDPYSIGAYRRFVDRLEKARIPYVEVVGNHNRHDIIDKLGEGVWPTAIHDHVFCAGGEEWIAQSICGKTLVAANWMPREKLLPFLEKMKAEKPDILVLHQRCGGFMPVIAGNSEVSFDELAGAARYIAIGDIHVWGIHRPTPETAIVSTGSTEMIKIDEDPSKSVAIVHMDNPSMPCPTTVERILLHPRRQLILHVRSDIELSQARARIALDLNAGIVPMVSVIYVGEMQRGVETLKDELRGKVLWRDVPDAEVDSSASYEAAKASANTDMPAIIEEMINDDPALAAAAVSLWGSPENSGLILEGLKQTIRARYAALAPSTPNT